MNPDASIFLIFVRQAGDEDFEHLFAPLIDCHDFASESRQLSQFFLDILQPLVALAVRHLIQGAIALLPPILLILLMNPGNFRPQTHNLVLKHS